jgi:hypothetical protein
MAKLYTDKDLCDLGKALCNYVYDGQYIPNELAFKTTFLLNHPELRGLTSQQQDLLYEFDRFMDKYHPANHHTYKLVRNLCKSAVKMYLCETCEYRDAAHKFNMFTKTLPYDIITSSGLVVHITND